jgi:5-(carboxyamino)imidazole ribonucleotide synthase
LVENHHHHGILAKTQAPAVGTSHIFNQAKQAITTVMNHLGYVGVMALELFVTKDDRGHDYLLANEIAPRVHNSGHWSIEGAITSQFENHIRAVVDLPLGDTDNVHPAIMVNVLGQYPDISDVLAIDGAHYHSYHKAEREDRKIAHITLMPNDVINLEPALAKLVAILPNKVGLDKNHTSVVTQQNEPDEDITGLDNAGDTASTDTKNTVLANKDSQIDDAVNAKADTEKANK